MINLHTISISLEGAISKLEEIHNLTISTFCNFYILVVVVVGKCTVCFWYSWQWLIFCLEATSVPIFFFSWTFHANLKLLHNLHSTLNEKVSILSTNKVACWKIYLREIIENISILKITLLLWVVFTKYLLK